MSEYNNYFIYLNYRGYFIFKKILRSTVEVMIINKKEEEEEKEDFALLVLMFLTGSRKGH